MENVFKAAQIPNILILKDNAKRVSQLVLHAQFQLITAQVAKMDKFLIKQVDSVFLRSHQHHHLLHHQHHHLLLYAQIIVLHALTQPTVNNVVVGTTFTVWIFMMLLVFKHVHLDINQMRAILTVL
jgi:hypothetical protein